jgi:predicted RNase H-like HicB family nuclease
MVLDELRRNTMKFKIVLEKDEDGWFVATCPSLPGCISQGKTEKRAIKNMQEAIELHIHSLAEDGIPLKSGNGKKEMFVTVAV